MRALWVSTLLLLTGCAGMMGANSKLESIGQTIEQNTIKMEKAGEIIVKNTSEIKIYTEVMRYAIPIFILILLISDIYFFRKIKKKQDDFIKHLKNK